MKRTRCSLAVNTVAALRKNSVSKIAYRLFTAHFQKPLERWADFVAGLKETLSYLRFYAHPYVYSCALPPVVIAAILKALEIGMREPELREKTLGKRRILSREASQARIETGTSTTYIMPMVIGDRERMYRLGHEFRRGYCASPRWSIQRFRKTKICFRACVTAKHTRADFDEALNILDDTLKADSKIKATTFRLRCKMSELAVRMNS